MLPRAAVNQTSCGVRSRPVGLGWCTIDDGDVFRVEVELAPPEQSEGPTGDTGGFLGQVGSASTATQLDLKTLRSPECTAQTKVEHQHSVFALRVAAMIRARVDPDCSMRS